MQIKLDPVTGLWCRSDGAVLMPPSKGRFKTFRWTFGFGSSNGYKAIGFHGKHHFAHQIICRSFHGLPPEGKPCVDHINRIRDDNRSCNIHWASYKENMDNRDCVDRSIEKYKVRTCEDRKTYTKVWRGLHHEEKKAYDRAYREAHHEKCRAYDAAKRAKMKAKGLTYRKGPNGKWGWYPRVHKNEAA